MTHLPLRIAVLECDTPLDNIKAKYGGYGNIFEALLKASAAALDPPTRLDPDRDLQISKWDVVNGEEYPRLEDIDAILMTGSSMCSISSAVGNHNTDVYRCAEHNSYDDLPWINKLVEFTQKVYAHDRVRIIGVCFGHQIVGRALGVKVGPSDLGWEIAVCDMDLTSTGKELFGKEKLVSFPQVYCLTRYQYRSSAITFQIAEPAADA